MGQTLKYCDDCRAKLSPATAKTEEEKELLRAMEFEPGIYTDFTKDVRTEEGVCMKCKKGAIVTYYELPE